MVLFLFQELRVKGSQLTDMGFVFKVGQASSLSPQARPMRRDDDRRQDDGIDQEKAKPQNPFENAPDHRDSSTVMRLM
jgi:hypothetical protein